MGPGDKTMPRPTTIHAALEKKRRQPEAVLQHVGEGEDIIVGMRNCEPATVLDAMEAHAVRLFGVRAHQMLPCRERRYMHGVYPGLRHVSWFLSPAGRLSARGPATWCPTTSARCESSIRKRTRRLIAIAHPRFRDELEQKAEKVNYL
jgi:hypothetical protein